MAFNRQGAESGAASLLSRVRELLKPHVWYSQVADLRVLHAQIQCVGNIQEEKRFKGQMQ